MEKDRQINDRNEVKEQILAIRDSGLANMLDRNAVQRLAYEREFYELACFIEEQPGKYSRFILSGDETLLPR